MGRAKKPLKFKLRPETVHSIVAVVLIAIGLLVMISLSGQGVILKAVQSFLSRKIGASLLFLPFVFISAGMVMFKTKWFWSKPNVLLGTLLILLGNLGLFQTGEIGLVTFQNIAVLISVTGAYVVFVCLYIIGALIISQLSVHEIAEFLGKFFPEKSELPAQADDKQKNGLVSQEDIEKARGFSLPKLGSLFGKSAAQAQDSGFSINTGVQMHEPTKEELESALALEKKVPQASINGQEGGELNPEDELSLNSQQIIWEYPPLSLLSASDGGDADRGDVKKNAATIEHTLESFNISARVKEVNYGPSVTQYALEINRGTKLSKITGLTTDLALALAAPGGQIRIEAPIAGRSLVGVEVPNKSSQFVTLRKMLADDSMKKHPSKLAVALGISVSGQPLVADIAKMPHVLIAGSTGSGKSVCINTFMCSILFRASPNDVKFILVDPKRVELIAYNNIPHLLTPVIFDPKKVVSALKWATAEMDRRYKQLAEAGVKNIADYNELAGLAAMHNIVIVIDELADIMLFAPSEVEECITRIAQMARAVGIHLVLATQRPSVDVITGLIKANVPTRIAFNVSSMTDSRVVLDAPGAEKLLGKGDMLYVPPDQSRPSRVQGTYVSEPEIKGLIDFIKSQGQKPEYSEDITDKYQSSTIGGKSSAFGSGDEGGRDPLFDEVVRFVAQAGKGSSSAIQRRFSVGYNRAARILDNLASEGMVGPEQGSKPREVNTAKIMEYLRSTTQQPNE